MSDGVPLTIPGTRTQNGEPQTVHVSTDEAAEIAAQLVRGMASEYITGTEDLYDDHDTRVDMERQALGEVKNELYRGPYSR